MSRYKHKLNAVLFTIKATEERERLIWTMESYIANIMALYVHGINISTVQVMQIAVWLLYRY